MNKLSSILGVVRHQLAVHVPRLSASTALTSVTKDVNKGTEEAKQVKTDEKHVGLMEFFDVKANWMLKEVRVGRSWKKEELRIKSNQDLHKLWFVLLKERNMLLTMQHELNDRYESFPSPERIDKVHESMVNLEEVVRERNKAYHQLETGETGERPGKLATNQLGMHSFRKMNEHVIPLEESKYWNRLRDLGCNRREVAKFRLYYNEKKWLEKLRARRRETRHIMQLFKMFPNIDEEALQDNYPNVDVQRIKRWKGAQGHYTPTVL